MKTKKEASALAVRESHAAVRDIQELADALAVCRDIPSVREIRDQAKAIETYIRARGVGVEKLADAAEVTLRAERRLGQLCAEVATPGRAKKTSQRVTLSDLGITRQQSSRWQKLADVPEDLWDERLRAARAKQERITVRELLGALRSSPTSRGDDVIDVESQPDESWLHDELEARDWSITAAQRAHVLACERTHGVPRALELLRAIVWSQWDTPSWLACEMVTLAELGRRPRVLEPAAGRGAIVRAVCAAHHHAIVTAHEIDPERVTELVELSRRGQQPALKDLHIVSGNFLNYPTSICERRRGGRAPFDASVQNTAYEGGLDGAFLERVMTITDRVVALLRTNALHGTDRYERVWSQCERGGPWGVHSIRYLRKRPEFESAIADGSAKSDFVIVRLDRGYRGKADVAWLAEKP